MIISVWLVPTDFGIIRKVFDVKTILTNWLLTVVDATYHYSLIILQCTYLVLSIK